jgi:hypothetical protein
MAQECPPHAAGFERRKELQLSLVKVLLEVAQKQPAEQAGQHFNRQKEVRSAGNPTLAIERKATAGHHAMQVGMMQEVLSPGVEHGEKANLSAQVLGIDGDGL